MPLYMRKDEYGYKFVRPIPEKLRTHFDQANFIKRLGRDYRQAKITCAELAVETDRRLEAAKSGLANQDSIDAYFKLDAWKRLKAITVTPELSSQLASTSPRI